MIRNLLVCGLIAGSCGGLLAAGFAELAGEPSINQAIAFEEAQAESAGEVAEHAHHAHEHEVVSRDVQRSVGLLTAAVVYGLALGGLFALAFAAIYGRVARTSPAKTALWLAAGAFIVVYLVPFLKYPAHPPAVGDPETIGQRTLLYVVMIAISVLAAIAAVRLRSVLSRRGLGSTATVAVGATYLAIVVIAGIVLPGVHEVPATFPATTLWSFRVASVGMQAVVWATIGLVFAALAQRAMAGKPIWQR